MVALSFVYDIRSIKSFGFYALHFNVGVRVVAVLIIYVCKNLKKIEVIYIENYK